MIQFILNNRLVETDKKPGMSLLDYIRYEVGLPGTKVGCREGDCGACTVLIGELNNNKVDYKSIVSCLTPLVNVHGKHVVTIEGINLGNDLTPVQKAMVENAATQCGFCTPGFVMSFTGFCMNHEKPTTSRAIESVAGNICRCTGYKSIQRAAEDITRLMQDKDIKNPVDWLVSKGYLPKYFLSIPDKLAEIHSKTEIPNNFEMTVAGGTDLMVQKSDTVYDSALRPTKEIEHLQKIKFENQTCIIGGAATVTSLLQTEKLIQSIDGLRDYLMLVSSEPVRNIATIAGNIVNASPIADLSIMLLALNAQISSEIDGKVNTQPLDKLYTGYKQLKLQKGELITEIRFELPNANQQFNFEKVSKRQYLDIASVNSAMVIKVENNTITDCRISAGGVAPIPLYLQETSQFLIGKKISEQLFDEANDVMQNEISPIGDVRGTVEYKRLLLKQLLFAHFAKLFPDKMN